MFPKIAFWEYDYRPNVPLADVPLAELRWIDQPIPEGKVRDLMPDDHLLFITRTSLLWGSHQGVRCKLSMVVQEPFTYIWRYYPSLPFTSWRLHRILSNHRPLVALFPNARFLPAGNSWVKRPDDVDCTKTRRMSLIASKLNAKSGHKLRHDIAAWCRTAGLDVDLLGRAYREIENKADGLAPYMFSIVIENNRQAGYFTEKLVDALVCRAVPIYWGAPDIAEFFDPRGMIVCSTEHEVRDAAKSLGRSDYERMLPALERNRQIALRYISFKRNAVDFIRDELSGTPHFWESTPTSNMGVQ